jgi:endonuclease/exonuclease/phosphatase family metal-dependent hydrolase
MDLKVISFNIRCTNDPDGHSIKERAPRVLSILKKYNPDLIGLQEYTPLWEEYIPSGLPEYQMLLKYRNVTEWAEGGPILWKKDRFELVKSGYFWYSDTPENESRGWCSWGCYRICTYVILREIASGECVTFMNTHVGFGDDGQVKSARLTTEYRDRISTYPTFITGDFNMMKDAPAYAIMTEFWNDANAMTLGYDGPTYHGYNPPKHAEDNPIDFCFTDKRTIPISFKILDETFDGKFPSDHYGFLAELKTV